MGEAPRQKKKRESADADVDMDDDWADGGWAHGAASSATADQASTQDSPKGKGKGQKTRGGKKSSTDRKFTSDQVAQVMPVVCKVAFWTAQSCRDLEPATMDVLRMPSDHLAVARMKLAETGYAAEGHSLGPPHIHVYLGHLEVLAEQEVGAANKGLIKAMIQKLNALEASDLVFEVRCAGLKKCFSDKVVKVVLVITDLQFRKALVNSLVQVGADNRTGRAPPSGLEQALQRLLDSFG